MPIYMNIVLSEPEIQPDFMQPLYWKDVDKCEVTKVPIGIGLLAGYAIKPSDKDGLQWWMCIEGEVTACPKYL